MARRPFISAPSIFNPHFKFFSNGQERKTDSGNCRPGSQLPSVPALIPARQLQLAIPSACLLILPHLQPESSNKIHTLNGKWPTMPPWEEGLMVMEHMELGSAP